MTVYRRQVFIELVSTRFQLYTSDEPFSQLNSFVVSRQVLSGIRPPRPLFHGGEEMADDLWAVVRQCWVEKPDERPTAEKLVELLAGCRSPVLE